METDFIKTELQKFNIADAVIAKMSAEYLPLKIKSLDDKEGTKAVHSARMIIVKKRGEVEKKRKELKRSSIDFGNAVDAEAKRITALLEPIETHLYEEESIFEKERERLSLEAEEKAQKKLQVRVNILKTYNYTMYLLDNVKNMSDNDFELVVAQAKIGYEVEQARMAEETRKVRVEEERLAKIKADQEAESKRLAEIARQQREAEEKIKLANEKIENEKRAIEDEKNRIINELLAQERAIEAGKQRAIEIEQAKKKAIEDTEKRLKAESEESARKIQVAAEAKRKKDARAPDKEKLANLSNAFNAIVMPSVSSPEAIEIIRAVTEDLKGIQHYLLANIERL